MSNYLRREADSFIFRRRVPDHLQRRFGQQEIYRSLKTTVRKTARARAAHLFVMTERLFLMAEEQDETVLPDEDIKAAVRHWLNSTTWKAVFDRNLNKLSPGVLREHHLALPEMLLTDEEEDGRQSSADENAVDHAWSALEYSGYEGAGRGKTLDRTVAVLRQTLKEYVDSRMQAVFAPETITHVSRETTAAASSPSNMEQISSFTTSWQEDIVKGYNQREALTEETTDQYLQTVELFVGLMGDPSLGTITFDLAAEYREKLLRLPASHGKGRTGSVKKELVLAAANKSGGRMTMKTAKRHFSGMNSIWKWLIYRKHVPATPNPFSGHSFPGTKSKKSARDAWSSEDLQRLLSSSAYRNADGDSAMHWLPLIGLFSGMRLEEICRLRPDSDFITRDKVYCFDIKAREGWDPKTEAGTRLVPVHSWLLKRGFKEFVDRQKGKGAEHLFPELVLYKKKISSGFSREFSRIKTENGIGKKTAFHSFRHTFRTVLESTDHKESHINAVMGHEGGGGEGRVYIKGVTTARLKEVVESFESSLELGFLNDGKIPVAPTRRSPKCAVKKVKLTPPIFDENGKRIYPKKPPGP
jgi:integrase